MKRTIIIAILLLPALCFGAMYQAEVIVGWTGKGTREDPNRPDWKGFKVDKYEDVTGQPGTKIPAEPNLFVAKIEADNETIAKMKDDGYIILWTQRVPDKGELGTPTEPAKPMPKQTQAELDKLKYDLTYKGFPEKDVAATAMADTAKADVTAKDISTQLKDVMSKFPAKAKSEAGETIKP